MYPREKADELIKKFSLNGELNDKSSVYLASIASDITVKELESALRLVSSLGDRYEKGLCKQINDLTISIDYWKMVCDILKSFNDEREINAERL